MPGREATGCKGLLRKRLRLNLPPRTRHPANPCVDLPETLYIAQSPVPWLSLQLHTASKCRTCCSGSQPPDTASCRHTGSEGASEVPSTKLSLFQAPRTIKTFAEVLGHICPRHQLSPSAELKRGLQKLPVTCRFLCFLAEEKKQVDIVCQLL